jgi:hypothetical protein
MVCVPIREFNRSIKPMGKIPQVNDKIDRENRAKGGRLRSANEAVAANCSV